jgi:hypothetical protein
MGEPTGAQAKLGRVRGRREQARTADGKHLAA